QPQYAEAYYNRAIAHNKIQKYQEAIADHQAAIKLKSDYAEAYGNLGLVYQTIGNKKEAVKNLEQAATLFKQQNKQALYQYVLEKLNAINLNPKF
ncbi:MAG: tetratricopeptide repeat protein, partial [Waterburya sp.]